MTIIWKLAELTGGGIDDADSEGDLLTIRVGTPVGLVHIMADVEFENDGRFLILKGVHIHSEGGPRSIGIANLRVLADFILAKVNCDEAIVEGASRSTGANPGHLPRPVRFIRRARPSQGT